MTPGLWDRMPTRRALLTSAAALAGCGRHKGRRFNGSAFIANEAAHSVAVIDMADFVLAKRIGLPGAPAEVTRQTSPSVVTTTRSPPNTPVRST